MLSSSIRQISCWDTTFQLTLDCQIGCHNSDMARRLKIPASDVGLIHAFTSFSDLSHCIIPFFTNFWVYRAFKSLNKPLDVLELASFRAYRAYKSINNSQLFWSYVSNSLSLDQNIKSMYSKKKKKKIKMLDYQKLYNQLKC